MKRNDITGLQTKTIEELRKQATDLRAELAKARFEKRAGSGRANLRALRDDLARVLSVLTYKQQMEKINN